MKNNFLNYFYFTYVILFFPSFVSGVFLPNLLLFFFLIINILFKFKKIMEIIINNYLICIIFFSFCFFILISSLLSNYITHSLETSLLYFLYLIYTSSLIILLSYKKYLRLFFICGMITCLILSLDAMYEFYNGTNLLGFSSIDGRLAGLFGDRWLLGRYLVYVLPILIAIYFLENEFFNDYKILIFIVFFLTCVTIVFSGERAAFLILLLYLSLLFFYFVTKLSIFKLFQILFVLTIFFISPFLFSDTSERLLDNFVLYLTSLNLDKNQYLSMFLTSWNMFIDNPLFGVGPNNFRYACSEEIYYLSKFSCSTHPHNIVFQILAEIGIIGFIAVYSVLFYFILKSFPYIKSKYFSKSSFGMYSLQCSVILYLFPFMISGNFFLSWYGMIYYLPIGLFMVYLEKLK